MGNKLDKIKAGVKEGVRKFLVTLKRNPQYIPLGMLLISFFVYSLNFTHISRTTEIVLGKGMGLCSFVAMLFSMLLFICMLNAFPKRQKPNILMIVLIFLLLGIIIAVDVIYNVRLTNALAAAVGGLTVTKYPFIATAQSVIIAHIALTALTAVSVALEPVFAKLLKKINTSIDVEDNGKIEKLDLSED